MPQKIKSDQKYTAFTIDIKIQNDIIKIYPSMVGYNDGGAAAAIWRQPFGGWIGRGKYIKLGDIMKKIFLTAFTVLALLFTVNTVFAAENCGCDNDKNCNCISCQCEDCKCTKCGCACDDCKCCGNCVCKKCNCNKTSIGSTDCTCEDCKCDNCSVKCTCKKCNKNNCSCTKNCKTKCSCKKKSKFRFFKRSKKGC